jgi:hypothetical protein
MNEYNLICEALSHNITGGLKPNQTKFSRNPEKARSQKRFLVKLSILGFGIAATVTSLLVNPAVRQHIMKAVREKKGKPLVTLLAAPLMIGLAGDVVAAPLAGSISQKWQNVEDERRKLKRDKK